MSQLVLSLFPGIGLLDMAFEEEGFCVVRGPDYLWGGDVRRFRPMPGRFDGVIGGPPCQFASRLAHMVRQNGAEPTFGNLIPEFERCVREAQPRWFVMENVPDAPVPIVGGYRITAALLNNRLFGADAHRERRFSIGTTEEWPEGWQPPGVWQAEIAANVRAHSPRFTYAGGDDPQELATKRNRKGTMPWNHKGAKGFRQALRAQGLPDDFDIPPFTVAEKCHAVRNGVPLPMGRAVARAVKRALRIEVTSGTFERENPQ